jgi:DNA-binding transcriptional LysR family regulator
MDLNLLSTFVAVADTSSFSAASVKAGVMRSSVSRSIAALERDLGVQLFNRTTRNVALTTAGTALYAKVAPHLASLANAVGALPERESLPSGTLRVTAPLDIGALILPEVLTAFSMRYPAVQLDMRLTNRTVDLVAEGFDAAIRVMPQRRPSSSLVTRKLTELEMNVFASPTYLARAGTPRTIDEAAAHAWIVLKGFKMPGTLAAIAKAKPRFIADDVLFVTNAVVAGGGLGLVPTFHMRDHLIQGKVTRVLPRVALAAEALHFVYAPTRHVPRKVSALRDFLVEHFAARPLTTTSDAR